MFPSLSLIIVTHNYTHFLPRLLDSVLPQQFPGLELVIVDDCSDIPCDAVVNEYEEKGMAIRLIRSNVHIQTRAARLLGVQHAQAAIIGFADADDILWGERTLEYHLTLMQNTGADMLHFRSVLVDENMHFTEYCHYHDPIARELKGEEIFLRYLQKGIPSVPTWTKLYRKQLWLDIMPIAQASDVERYYEDTYLTTVLFLHAQHYIASDHCGYAHYLLPRAERNAGRAVDGYRILKELLPVLRKRQRSQEEINLFIKELKRRICIQTGRFCRDLSFHDTFDVCEDELERKLAGLDREIFFKALLLCNSINAKKITKTIQTMFTVPD